MKDNESFDELVKEIQSLPEPDYEKKFNQETQEKIHQDLINFQKKYKKPRRGRPVMKKWVIGFSGLVALLLIFVLSFNMIPHKQLATTNQKTQQTNTGNPKKSQHPQQAYNYKKYLSFTPLLPSHTFGHKVTSAIITRYLNTQQGNAISFSVSYGKVFSITEMSQNQQKFSVPYQGPRTKITIGNNIHGTMQKHDGGATIEFTKNNLNFMVTYINHSITLQQLKKISQSISVPASIKPTEIHLSDQGAQSAKELSFKPIVAGQFYVPKGLKLSGQGSAINIMNGTKDERFQINYAISPPNGKYLTIAQSTPKTTNGLNNGDYHTEKINGVTVHLQQQISQLSQAVYFDPKLKTRIDISTNLSTTELKKVIDSLINVSLSNSNGVNQT